MPIDTFHGTQDVDISEVSVGSVPVTTVADGTVSTENSSATLLTNGTTFTGTVEDVSTYPSITVAVKTDQNNKLYVDYSTGGTKRTA